MLSLGWPTENHCYDIRYLHRELLSKYINWTLKPQVVWKSVRLINVDVIYLASLVKYSGDTGDKTEKKTLRLILVYKV